MNGVLQNLFFSAHCPVVGLSIRSHLVQEETSRTMTERGTGLWVLLNVIRGHFVAMFLKVILKGTFISPFPTLIRFLSAT